MEILGAVLLVVIVIGVLRFLLQWTVLAIASAIWSAVAWAVRGAFRLLRWILIDLVAHPLARFVGLSPRY